VKCAKKFSRPTPTWKGISSPTSTSFCAKLEQVSQERHLALKDMSTTTKRFLINSSNSKNMGENSNNIMTIILLLTETRISAGKSISKVIDS
jgi:hypothetical protein